MTNLICRVPLFTADPKPVLSTSRKSCIFYILCLIKWGWKGEKKYLDYCQSVTVVFSLKTHVNSGGSSKGWCLDSTAVPKHLFLNICETWTYKRTQEKRQRTSSMHLLSSSHTCTPSSHTPRRVWNHLVKDSISIVFRTEWVHRLRSLRSRGLDDRDSNTQTQSASLIWSVYNCSRSRSFA